MKIKHLILMIFLKISYSVLFKNSWKDDFELCGETSDTNQCKQVQLISADLQCCIAYANVKLTDGREADNKKCSTSYKPFSIISNYLNSKIGNAILKETLGYQFMKQNYANLLSEFTTNMNCDDGSFNKKINFNEYNDDDKSILKSKDYCLEYSSQDSFVTEEKCLNAKVMKRSANIGLTCGYYEYHINLSDGSSKVYKSCNFFDRNAYNTKNLDDFEKYDIKEYIYKDLGLNADNYVVYITGVKNKTLIYDSSNDTVIYD